MNSMQIVYSKNNSFVEQQLFTLTSALLQSATSAVAATLFGGIPLHPILTIERAICQIWSRFTQAVAVHKEQRNRHIDRPICFYI